VIDCNEWKTEKRHERANIGKVKQLELWWQLYRTSLPERDVHNIRPMDFCSTECTTSVFVCCSYFHWTTCIHVFISSCRWLHSINMLPS